MILIIAEKPSLARNITAGIGRDGKRRDGYIECGEYLVSWAFGHLFSLADIEYYNPRESRGWSMENLPCFPEKFSFVLRSGDDGVRKQFETLKYLCNRPDVTLIINAGDADREGEIIVRTCIEKALEAPKQIKRLWLPDQTPETVAAALADMKSSEEYDRLAAEGYARTYIDWLYGVNLTRYATLRTGALLRVGRVIVPIVRAIYERDMAIENFKPEIYYSIVSREKTGGEEIELASKKRFLKDEIDKARAECDKYNASEASVTALKRKKDTVAPGKLYSLSKLQNALGKKYKMSMSDSLEVVQKLYEEGYLTYPRTNSEYMATAEKDKIRKIIENCKKLGYALEFKDKKTIFDDSKIESHSAITPTYKIPDKARLTEREMLVYQTVFRRFAAVFCAEDCIAERIEMTISVKDCEDFILRGMTVLQRGWLKYDDGNQKDKILPALKKGDKVNIRFEPAEKETTPPKHFTIETLNNYLKNPFREEKAQAEDGAGEDDAEEYRAMFDGVELGTEATRTGIIDNARNSGYIELKKDVYRILNGGKFFIESLDRLGIGMDKYKTAEMGRALKKVFRGEYSIEEAVMLARQEISPYFEQKTVNVAEDTDTGFFGDLAGNCPVCGKEVIRYRYNYGCSGYKEGCKFKIPSFLCGRPVSLQSARALLLDGRTTKINGFLSKSGKNFEAALVLDRERGCVFDFT